MRTLIKKGSRKFPGEGEGSMIEKRKQFLACWLFLLIKPPNKGIVVCGATTTKRVNTFTNVCK
jgi:hypothetical protein